MRNKYGTLVIGTTNDFAEKRYVDAQIKVIMNVEGRVKNQKRKVFKKGFTGPATRLEEIFSGFFSLPIDSDLFGDTTFLDRVRNVELNFPSTDKGKELRRYVEKVVKSFVPNRHVSINYF